MNSSVAIIVLGNRKIYTNRCPYIEWCWSPFHPPLLPPTSEGWGKVIFSVCSHLWGGGYPISGLRWGGTPFQVWGGTPFQVWGGTPSHVWGGIPSQVWGVPHLWGYPMMGVPHLGGYPMSGGYPITRPPPHCTEQHSKHLLRGRRCASCVHAGGLLCLR